MSSVRSQIASTPMRLHPYRAGSPLPERASSVAARPHPAPVLPERRAPEALPVPAAAAGRSRFVIQNEWMVLMLATAALLTAAGVIYLTGYARLVRETYRSVHLASMLQQERNKTLRLQLERSIHASPTVIEHRAKAELQMAPADEKQAIVVH